MAEQVLCDSEIVIMIDGMAYHPTPELAKMLRELLSKTLPAATK